MMKFQHSRPPPQVGPPTELPAEKAARDVRQETGASDEGLRMELALGKGMETQHVVVVFTSGCFQK